MPHQDDDDVGIAAVTNGMQGVKIPSDNSSDVRMESVDLKEPQQQAAIPPPQQATKRPFDLSQEAGPAADPIAFPPFQFTRGKRETVCCYSQKSHRHFSANNVLFQDFTSDVGDPDKALQKVEQAYWPHPHKQPIDTIMGHVSICIVLKRCRHTDDSDVDSDAEDEDIVFTLTNEFVAIKVNYYERMERLKGKHAEDPRKEIAAMQLIGNEHPNVIGCIQVLFDGSNLNVVMPYCGSGDLFAYLNDPTRPMVGLSEDVARQMFRQVIAGLRHLHSKGICHRDLSPENILMDGDGCLIIDMGMCLRIPYTTDGTNVTDITHGIHKLLLKPQGTCGKKPYMSPEIFVSLQAFDGEAVDVWTAGTILFCMLSGNKSYDLPHKTDPQFYWMTHNLPALMEDWGVSLSNEAMDLLSSMIQIDPRLRPTIEEVENHAWFRL